MSAMRQLLQCVQRVAVLIYENVCCGVALAVCCSVLQCVAVLIYENVCEGVAVA